MSDHDCARCTGCTATNRREFLRQAAGAAVALTALSGLDAARAAATPVHGMAHGASALRYPVPAEDGAIIDRENEVIIMRQERRAYAFALSCPHQRTMLKWLDSQNRFQCPKHKSKYQPDGAFISGRATRAMDRHAIRLVGRELVVDRTVLYRSDKAAAEWASASVVLPR